MYGNNSGSSVGVYKNKKGANEDKQCLIDNDALYLETLCGNAISRGVTNMSTVIPEIRYHISPIINSAFIK